MTPGVLVDDGWYWCDREYAATPWRVRDRVGAKTFGNGRSVSEAEYAATLNAAAPSAVDNRCLRGSDISTRPEGWALIPYKSAP